ncbi:MAG: cytochrome c, partial [Candidatus Dadabacteria bacterium]|nr:cytochrome c [Candidatus Dadabacteria bacterium]NIQ13247.1 cytochrome c [Candidatus Dadabacteria bacterium]
MNKILLGSIITLIVIIAISFIYMSSGIYNLSATKPHMKVTESAIHIMKGKSIKANSKNIEVPNLDDKNLVLNGYEGYDAMCVTCHAAPGKSASVIADGLYPPPPELNNK